MFALLLRIIRWYHDTAELPGVVRASQARDIIEDFEEARRWNDLAIDDPRRYPGMDYLGAFASRVDRVAGWVDTHL